MHASSPSGQSRHFAGVMIAAAWPQRPDLSEEDIAPDKFDSARAGQLRYFLSTNLGGKPLCFNWIAAHYSRRASGSESH